MKATTADWQDTYGDTALKGTAGVEFVQRLAEHVIRRAVEDIKLGPDEARTALVFLYGPNKDCDGWLGLMGVRTEFMRPRVVRYYEMQRDRLARMDKQAQERRKRARIALARIRDYVLHGVLPKSEAPTDEDMPLEASRTAHKRALKVGG